MPATEEDRTPRATQATAAIADLRIILAGLWTALMLV